MGVIVILFFFRRDWQLFRCLLCQEDRAWGGRLIHVSCQPDPTWSHDRGYISSFTPLLYSLTPLTGKYSL